MNGIFEKDLDYICENIDFNAFSGKSILITGSTGLIGFTLVSALLRFNHYDIKPKIIAFARNIEKAKKIFGNMASEIRFAVGDVCRSIDIQEPIDYIIHAASNTSSQAFVNEPVNISKTALIGTINLLELAKEKKVSSFVFLSSMEVYGTPSTDEKISETHGINLDTMKVRTCYPEEKRMCESLCASYFSQYDVPAKVVCLTQTFGPGVRYSDGRVFAEFARCVIEGRDIVLHTKGETKRNYLYTADAATAIFTVLLKGENGEKYNVANEETYCTIKEMADLVAEKCADVKIKVRIKIEDSRKFGYAPVLHMNLDITKLQNLGWKPFFDLISMYNNLCATMERKL